MRASTPAFWSDDTTGVSVSVVEGVNWAVALQLARRQPLAVFSHVIAASPSTRGPYADPSRSMSGVGCRFLAAIHPGRLHTRVVTPCISRCKMRRVRDLRAPTVVLIDLVGSERHGLAGPQQVGPTESQPHDALRASDFSMKELASINGRYEGAGQWYDAAGKSGSYRVVQTNRALPLGIEVAFRHDFDDGTVTDARLTLSAVAPRIFQVKVSENTVGHGSWLDDTLHYHMQVGDKFVEASYRPNENGLRVYGSSTRNAEGNYIVWVESLNRVSDG